MAHNINPSEHPDHRGEIGRLTIVSTSSIGSDRELRVSRSYGGLCMAITDVSGKRTRGPVVKGEDLFALREMLAEIPEEAFVRPADPVEAPPFWSDGDLVEFVGRHVESLFRREADGTWNRVWSNQPNRLGPACDMDDTALSGAMATMRSQYRVVRRANA